MQVLSRPDDRNEVMIIQIIGDLDLSSVPNVRSAVLAALADGWRYLVVDTSGVEFLDSAGIGVLIGARRRFIETGGSLIVVGLGSTAHKALVAADVDTLFVCEASVESAVELFRGSAVEVSP